ncbi:LamG domain-containing protein [Candidatus Nanosalina sp. VS9-1]|uniref:LamG domain-containing protein n=1 Tax=Candidatus Nanosalina sp. VS9-1 TaxID=3388566 RepID=UPI0039E0D9E4
MPKLSWNGDDFQNPQDSSGTATEKISGGGLEQGYFHGSLTRGLVAYYPMSSGSGSTLFDSTALSNDGTLKPGGSGTTSADNMWTSGKLGSYSLSFDGTDDYVEIPDPDNYTLTQPYTISCWIYPRGNSSANNPGILAKGPFNDNADLQMEYREASDERAIRFLHDWNTDNHFFDSSAGSVPLNQWSLITFTYAGGVRKIYVNSVEENSYSDSTGQDTNSNSWWIGQKGGTYFDGKIDDIRFYNRKLSEPEIQALYNLSNPSKISEEDTLV